jgi:hypothetical protein
MAASVISARDGDPSLASVFQDPRGPNHGDVSGLTDPEYFLLNFS